MNSRSVIGAGSSFGHVEFVIDDGELTINPPGGPSITLSAVEVYQLGITDVQARAVLAKFFGKLIELHAAEHTPPPVETPAAEEVTPS